MESRELTLVTRKVAKSSLSNLPPPILSPPAVPPFLRWGGTYEDLPAPRPPGPSGVSAWPAATSTAPSSPKGAMVPLKGHLAVKCSPLQIRHLTCLSFNLFFMAPASETSSLASFLQFVLGLNIMFSPTLVVSEAGWSHEQISQHSPLDWNTFKLTPAASFWDNPNLPQDFLSATLGFTISLTFVNLMRRVVLTFFPSSLNLQVTIVCVPSLLVVVVDCGSSLESSRSSSSAQSRLLWCLLDCAEAKLKMPNFLTLRL